MAVTKGMPWTATDRFGIDEETRELYWDGKKIITGHVVTLQLYERVLATIVAAASVAAAVHPFGQSFGWWP